jgi:hypothetical protein
VIDMIRADSVSKALRDDYTAYNLLAISYTMLHTTSMALKDDATKAFAEQGLRTYAGLVQDINNVLPEAVVTDLMHGESQDVIDPNIVDECRKTVDSIWKSAA